MIVIDYITITCNLQNGWLQITCDYMKKCNRLQLITITNYDYPMSGSACPGILLYCIIIIMSLSFKNRKKALNPQQKYEQIVLSIGKYVNPDTNINAVCIDFRLGNKYRFYYVIIIIKYLHFVVAMMYNKLKKRQMSKVSAISWREQVTFDKMMIMFSLY